MTYIKLQLILYFFFVQFSLSHLKRFLKEDKKCYALVLSGGGSKGAYEAGALYQLVHSLPPEEVKYDVVSGVSAGSINAAYVSTFEPGSEQLMVDWMTNMYLNLTTPSVWKSWPWGILYGIFRETGVFDDSPLYHMVKSIMELAGTIKRKLVVSAADSMTGKYIAFSESIPIDEIHIPIVGSASIPAVFPAKQYKDYLLIDGGTIWNTNLITAVDRCKEIVDDDSQIVMDLIICQNAKIEHVNKTSNTIGNYMRFRQIKGFYKTLNDVLEFKKARPKVNYRYLIIPSKEVASFRDEIRFN